MLGCATFKERGGRLWPSFQSQVCAPCSFIHTPPCVSCVAAACGGLQQTGFGPCLPPNRAFCFSPSRPHVWLEPRLCCLPPLPGQCARPCLSGLGLPSSDPELLWEVVVNLLAALPLLLLGCTCSRHRQQALETVCVARIGAATSCRGLLFCPAPLLD